MNIKEKASYVKGLFSGLDLDDDKKETKLLSAIIDWMDAVSTSVSNLDEDVDDICDQLDVLDEDLAEVENEVYEDSCDCECGDDCECHCDDDCDCGCHDDENFYEVVCPSCGEKICLSEDTLLDEEMDCPSCGELLEFDMDDCCDCDCDCDCEPECRCDEKCDCEDK